MNLPHRIAAGGIVIKDQSVLLVRYNNADGGTYLAAPGGRVEDLENASQAAQRETWEETGLNVTPGKLLFIEDLLCLRYKMLKIWMLCAVHSGEIQQTQGAKEEGIIDVGWFTREQLNSETVYPPPIKQYNWADFASNAWQPTCLPSQKTNF